MILIMQSLVPVLLTLLGMDTDIHKNITTALTTVIDNIHEKKLQATTDETDGMVTSSNNEIKHHNTGSRSTKITSKGVTGKISLKPLHP